MYVITVYDWAVLDMQLTNLSPLLHLFEKNILLWPRDNLHTLLLPEFLPLIVETSLVIFPFTKMTFIKKNCSDIYYIL